jgi:hypothetical protein
VEFNPYGHYACDSSSHFSYGYLGSYGSYFCSSQYEKHRRAVLLSEMAMMQKVLRQERLLTHYSLN